ncbi:MAG: sugar kinase [Candidatus Aminicenantes bacterium RBG_16_66_30]|nr:MAG: sugar kinase [Candidatus Aminicenantes bacterium RBG_16_66_30]
MNGPVVVGIDLGGTNVRAGLVAEGRLRDVRSVPVRSRGSVEDVLEDLFGAVDAVMRDDVAGIGAGVPSVIDLATGTVFDVQNIPSWKKVPLKARLEERYRRPAFVNNDANCFAAGEKHFGKIRPYDSAVGLIVGTGLGAGIIANGRLYSGANSGAGEFGMLSYLDRNLEAYASGQFFERVHGVSGRALAARAERGDGPALAIFAEFGRHVGEAVKAICYAVDPEIIVLGGSVSRSFRFFRAALWEAFQTYAYSLAKERLKIEVSETEGIAILGAAALYFDAMGAEKP